MLCKIISTIMGAAALCIMTNAGAQPVSPTNYPSRQVTFIVPYPAGGGTDTVARVIQSKLAELWKQTIVIENRPGGGGIVGNDLVAKAAPDGYTVLIGITQLVQAPAMGISPPYDVLKDFAPVSQCAVQPNLFIVPASSGVNSLAEFVVISRANPGKFSYGSFGAGTTSHLYGELLKKVTGIELTHVPYRGSAPLLNDVLAAHVQAAFIDPLTAAAQIQAGNVKALATTGPSRLKVLPDVPTLSELGYAGFEALGWSAAFVPAATPREIVQKLSADIAKVLRLPDVIARIHDLGSEPVGNTPDQFAAVLKADYEKWAKVVSEGNIKLH